MFGSSVRSLKDLIPETLFHIDVTRTDSYPGTGTTIFNLANDASYDFTITGNPVFTGAAGSPSAYFLMDGSGDRFSISANTSVINNFHKTTGGGQNFTLWAAFRFIQNDTAQTVFTTQTGSTAIGVSGNIGSNESAQFTQGDGVVGVTVSSAPSSIVNGTDYLFVMAHDHAGNASRRWINTTTGTQDAHTYNTEVDNASGNFTFMARPGGGSIVPNGTRFYAGGAISKYCTDSDITMLAQLCENWHQRDYTP